MDERIHEFVSLQRRGVIAVPAAIRERLHLDQPGAQLEFIEEEDGRITLRGALPVPSEQAWFWSERWQAMEREVDEQVAEARVARFASVEDLLGSLDA